MIPRSGAGLRPAPPVAAATWRGMSRPAMRVTWQQVVGGVLALLLAQDHAGALERVVRTRVANYEQAPVLLRSAEIRLVQTYSQPGQFPFVSADGSDVKIRRSRVRQLNHLNQQIPTYVLEGSLDLHNETRRSIETLQLTTVFFNAFRERIRTDRDTLTLTLGPRQQKTVVWSRGVPHEEVFEMVVVVSAVRFGDGSVWSPTEELILIP